MRRLRDDILNASLWLVSLGLMLASSGLDGAYMSKWMPGGWAWLGLVLNTMSDIAGMVIMYWFGRLQQSGRTKRRLSYALLLSEGVAIGYSWFFSWRQLRMVLPPLEPRDWEWVSAVAAGYIPLLLAFIGYAQSLLAGRVAQGEGKVAQRRKPAASLRESAAQAAPRRATIADWRKIYAQMDGERAHLRAQDVASALESAGLAPPSARSLQLWAKEARNSAKGNGHG